MAKRKTPPQPPPAKLDAWGDPLPPGAWARAGSARLRHADVRSLAFGDGVLFSAGAGGIRGWNVTDGRCIEAHGESVPAHVVGVSRDGALAWIDHAGWVHENVRRPDAITHLGIQAPSAMAWFRDGWTILAGRHLARRTRASWLATPVGPENAVRGAFARSRVAFVDREGLAWVYGVEVPDFLAAVALGAAPTAIALSPRGTTVAAGFVDGRIGLWDVASARQVAEWPAHELPVAALAYDDDGGGLASAAGARIRLWNGATGAERLELPTFEDAPASAGFPPEGRTLVLRRAGMIHEWDLDTGTELRAVAARGAWDDGNRGRTARWVTHADGAQVVVMDVALGREAARVPREGASASAVSFDGTRLALGFPHGNVRVAEVAGGRRIWEARPPFAPASAPEITLLAFSADGLYLAAGRTFEGVALVDAEGKHVGALTGPIAFAEDGSWIAVSLPGGGIGVYDLGRRPLRNLRTLHGHGAELRRLVAGPKNLLATAADDRIIRVWDVGQARSLAIFEAPAHDLAFSRDGAWLASICWDDGETLVWDLRATARA